MAWSCGKTALVSSDASLHSYVVRQHITVSKIRIHLLDVRCLHTDQRNFHGSQLLALRSLSYDTAPSQPGSMPLNTLSGLHVQIPCPIDPSCASLLCALLLQLLVEVVAGVGAGHMVAVPEGAAKGESETESDAEIEDEVAAEDAGDGLNLGGGHCV